MKLMKRPDCHYHERCGNEGIMLIGDKFMCYKCFEKLKKAMDDIKEEIMLRED